MTLLMVGLYGCVETGLITVTGTMGWWSVPGTVRADDVCS